VYVALNKFRGADESDASVHEMRAQCLLELDDPLLAAKEAHIAVDMSPNCALFYWTLGRCQREVGDVKLSLISYDTALELDSSSKMCLDERNEVLEIVRQLRLVEKESLDELVSSCASVEEEEVIRCKMHLLHRVCVTASQKSDK
jgi:hypothetical protein